MRKIWIVIPFGSSKLASHLFEYVSKINSSCLDVNTSFMWNVSNLFNTGLSVNKDNSFEFFTKERPICTVKQIEVDMQGFPDTPKVEQKAQPTSY